jgi:hypothetical protein
VAFAQLLRGGRKRPGTGERIQCANLLEAHVRFVHGVHNETPNIVLFL